MRREYKCPNCGRTYVYGDECDDIIMPCMNCRYPLKRAEDVIEVRHPELNEHKVIGYTTSSKPTVECPYCHSTKTKKISGTKRWLSTGIFGLASGKIGKQWHCNSCKSDF